jgi:membrane fusion protein, heavy metal efflux system
VPATIEANAYKAVVVKALAAGRVTRVAAQLGMAVRRGASLADLYSPELSESERAYVAAGAALTAHDRQLARTERLTEIGAASQQELEQAHAEHAAMVSALDGAQARLELLGVPADVIARLRTSGGVGASISVVAPIDGVITTRETNVGLNVEAGAPLFTVVDLSTVWAVASVFEHEAAAVHEGNRATVKIPGTSELDGTVSYIDPHVSSETRATQVRVELRNPGRALRLGTYADIVIDAGEPRVAVVVPASAIQTIGAGAVVYVEDPAAPGRFVERPVQLGAEMGDVREIVSGLSTGERVVVQGSFFVRAERERLGPAAVGSPRPQTTGGQPTQQARVVVSTKGFEPDRVSFAAGVPARLTFVRSTDQTCGTEVVFPDLNIRRTLPLNQEVSVDFVPPTGELAFACGMGMLQGRVIAMAGRP